jgi:hypothetical protein
MAVEQYANLAQSTLNGGISNVDVSATLVSGTDFSSSGDYRIRIELELIKVTARSGNVLTIVRGQEGTTAVSHASGSTVTQVVTATGLQAVGTVLHRTDTFANLPAAGTEGRLFLPSDGVSLLRDDGSAWSYWGLMNKWVPPPAAAGFTSVNVTTATLSDAFGGLFLNAPNISAAHGQFFVKTLAAGAYTWIARLDPVLFIVNDCQAGLALRDSAGAKIITFEYQTTASVFSLRVIQWTDANTRTGSALNLTLGGDMVPWMKITDNATNRTYSVSRDGVNWIDVLTEGRTTWLGVAPNQAGIFATANGAAVGLSVYSYTGV